MNQANSRCLWDSVGQRSWLPAICRYKERPPNHKLVNITLNSLWLINRNHAWNPCRTCWLFSAHFSHLFAPRCPSLGEKATCPRCMPSLFENQFSLRTSLCNLCSSTGKDRWRKLGHVGQEGSKHRSWLHKFGEFTKHILTKFGSLSFPLHSKKRWSPHSQLINQANGVPVSWHEMACEPVDHRQPLFLGVYWPWIGRY